MSFVVFTNGTHAFQLNTLATRLKRLRSNVSSWVKVAGECEDQDFIAITLTYRDQADWCPNDLRDYLWKIKRRSAVNGYCWVAELQARGVIHYHLVLMVNKGYRIEFPDQNGWERGFSHVELLYKYGAKSVFYFMKYLKKEYQKNYALLPKGARSHSTWFKADGLAERQRFIAAPERLKVFIDIFGYKQAKKAYSEAKKEAFELLGEKQPFYYATFKDKADATLEVLAWNDPPG